MTQVAPAAGAGDRCNDALAEIIGPGDRSAGRQRPASSFQQLTQVYWRQPMQKLNDSWKASSCAEASTSSERIASPIASPRASWLVR